MLEAGAVPSSLKMNCIANLTDVGADLTAIGLPLAYASLPLNLAVQQKPGTEDYRVSTITQIELGEIFGPIVAPSCAVSPSQPATSALGLVTAEGLKTFMFESNDKCNWMKFVRLSLNGSHNMEAIQKDGAVYFAVTKPIRPRVELKMTLSSSYAETIAECSLSTIKGWSDSVPSISPAPSEAVYPVARQVKLLTSKIGEEIKRCGWPDTMRALKLDHSAWSTVNKLLLRIVELPQSQEMISDLNMLEIDVLQRVMLWTASPDDERTALLTKVSASGSAISLTNSADIFVISPLKMLCSRYSASRPGANSAVHCPDAGTCDERQTSVQAGPQRHVKESPDIGIVCPIEFLAVPGQNLAEVEVSPPSSVEQLMSATASPPVAKSLFSADAVHVNVTSGQVYEINGEHYCLVEVPESCEIDGGQIETVEPEFELEAVEEVEPKISDREARRLARQRTKEELHVRKEERKLVKRTSRLSSRIQDSLDSGDQSDFEDGNEDCGVSEKHQDRGAWRKLGPRLGKTKPQSHALVHQRRKRSEATIVSELHVCTWPDCMYSTRSAQDFKWHVEKHEGVSGGADQYANEFGPVVEQGHVEDLDNVDDQVSVNEFGPTDLSFPEPVARVGSCKPPKKPTCTAEERKERLKEYLRVYRIRARLKKCNLPCDDEAVANYDPEDLFQRGYTRRKSTSQTRPSTESPYECSICGKVLASRIKYRQHINVIHKQSVPDPLIRVPQGVFTCDQCPHTTKTLGALNNHKRRMHAIQAVAQLSNECAVCLMIFSNNVSLGIHNKSHITVDGRHPCRFCATSFSSQKNVKTHIARAHAQEDAAERAHRIAAEGSVVVAKVPEHQCTVCLHYYSSKERVRQHFRRVHRVEFQTHLRQKFPDGDKFKCRQCEEGFCNRIALTAHVKCVHTEAGKAALACRFCEESFTGATEYYSHLQTHADASGRLQCPGCAESLPVSEFSQHYRTKHRAKYDGTSTCEVCGKILSCGQTLAEHMQRKHGIGNAGSLRSGCPLCGRLVGRGAILHRHLAREHGDEIAPEGGTDSNPVGRTYSDIYASLVVPVKSKKSPSKKKRKSEEVVYDDTSEESYEASSSDSSEPS